MKKFISKNTNQNYNMKLTPVNNAYKTNRLDLPDISDKDSLPRKNLSAGQAKRDKIEIIESTQELYQRPPNCHKPQ